MVKKTDTRKELEHTLSSATAELGNFKGLFSFAKTYSDAANPLLMVEGLGSIGLPLGERDADAFKSQSSGTAISPSTWEVSGDKVAFGNAVQWDGYMHRVMSEVYAGLGVPTTSHYKLCKLLLHGTESHEPFRVDTGMDNNVLATVIIVLPSKHTGGSIKVSHGGLSTEYDCSAANLTQTSILSWYNDVQCETAPIASGFRFALTLNIVHVSSSPLPVVPTFRPQTIDALAEVILAWEDSDPDTAPPKILLLLDRKYPQEGLRGGFLTGPDAYKLALLETVGRRHGLHLGLATVSCHKIGGSNCTFTRFKDCFDESDLEFDWECEEHMFVEHLVDPQGLLIRDYGVELWYSEDEAKRELPAYESIPKNIKKRMTKGEWDEQEYHKDEDELSRFYSGTVLVIWPDWNNREMLDSKVGADYACYLLQATTSKVWGEYEEELIDIALSYDPESRAQTVVSGVCKAAIVWDDSAPWMTAVEACDAQRSIATLQEENLFDAVAAFGFSTVRPYMEAALEQDPNIPAACEFLKKLEQRIKDHPDSAESMAWTTEWLGKLSLKGSATSEEDVQSAAGSRKRHTVGSSAAAIKKRKTAYNEEDVIDLT